VLAACRAPPPPASSDHAFTLRGKAVQQRATDQRLARARVGAG
jgi:hypothetical protein